MTHEELGQIEMPWGKYGPKNGKPGSKLEEIPTRYFDFMLENNSLKGPMREIFEEYRNGITLKRFTK